jgi:hypothetical protein
MVVVRRLDHFLDSATGVFIPYSDLAKGVSLIRGRLVHEMLAYSVLRTCANVPFNS